MSLIPSVQAVKSAKPHVAILRRQDRPRDIRQTLLDGNRRDSVVAKAVEAIFGGYQIFLNVPPGKSPSAVDRGPSDYDIRNTFAGAVSWYIPGPHSGRWKPILENCSVNSIVYARSAPPVNVVTGKNPFGGFLSGASSVQRPNVVPGVPIYLADPTAGGGKIINPAAFSPPPANGQGNLGRNALRGFNASQVDLTLQRRFQLSERFSLQASADMFNIFNHPNFGSPVNYLTSPLFGQSTQTLNNWLGSGGQSGGLNPLYQIGGPRSVQLALKLVF